MDRVGRKGHPHATADHAPKKANIVGPLRDIRGTKEAQERMARVAQVLGLPIEAVAQLEDS